MTFVVTEACRRGKRTDCVDACPLDAFREGPNSPVIDPDERIDCAACVPECPVNTIFAEEGVAADQQDFMTSNAERSRVWRTITKTKKALPHADERATIKDKRTDLQRRSGTP